jgi:hypothetical protein
VHHAYIPLLISDDNRHFGNAKKTSVLLPQSLIRDRYNRVLLTRADVFKRPNSSRSVRPDRTAALNRVRLSPIP